ncbi:MAG TPA: 2-hydroxyacyl-CoA dehydratase [Candidatus Sulfotelmatobacter sp.]|nr:2-hydroxyacyl-CoA dehydratase [Candidatus Sulfotelmatobacter sp.]
MGIEGRLEQCRALAWDTTFPGVRDWKNRHPGGKAVGVFPVYSPVEIYHAGGMLPVAVFGGGNTVDLSHADSRFVSFVCSISKSTLELGLQGRLKDFDALVFHSICDVARNLSSVFVRNFPEMHVEYIHLAQNPSSRGAVDYLAGEYRRVRDNLARRLGVSIPDEKVAASILAFNAARAKMRELYAFRQAHPHLLSTAELYLVIRAGVMLPIEEMLALLDEVLADLPRRAGRPRDRVRVLVEGAFCEQPPLGLLEVIEEAGCYIVDDDLALGFRWFQEDVSPEGDPIRALAEAYVQRSVYSSVRHDWRHKRMDALVEKFRRSGAQAVMFLPAKFCEPALFDYVLYRQALEKEGIPHLVVEFEEKMWTFERTRNEVQTFVESLLFE